MSEIPVRVEEIHGRGRGLVSSQPLKAGQIVLKDSPILIYSSFPLNKTQISASIYCDRCFRIVKSAPVHCNSCAFHHFCSPTCRSSAGHSPWLCQALTQLQSFSSVTLQQPPERQVQIQFLLKAYNLVVLSPPGFQILLSLQGRPEDFGDVGVAQFLHSLFSSACPPPPIDGFSFSLELTAALLAKEKINAFGLMEPLNLENGGQRSVRAYGIYPKAALFNHDCLPNACRFDYVDAGTDGNTDIIVRMIHDVPQGREICLSYFPVNVNYPARQKRLIEDYGFKCDCDRCKVEANWSDHEDEEGDGDDENEVMDEDVDEGMDSTSGDGNDTDFPHAYFFVRYMCNRSNCWGTLAPLPPSNGNASSSLLECNVCGSIKNDEVVAAGEGSGGLLMNHRPVFPLILLASEKG